MIINYIREFICVNDKMHEFASDMLMIKGELDEIY